MNSVSDIDNALPLASSDWMIKLPSILRGVGIVAILASLYGFFVRGWEGGDDLVRFLMLFGHTLALFGIGFLSGHFLKEGKGARILIMLALISVVANFSILGSFIYAEYGEALTQNFVSAMRWNLDNGGLVLLLAAMVTTVLMPVIYISFRVLARGMSNKMSVLFLTSNALLLLPLREPVVVAVLGVMLAVYTLFLVIKNHRQRLEAKTTEGKFALLIQFSPVSVLLVRNIWLYDDMSILYASACAVGFIALRQFALMVPDKSAFRRLSDIASALLCLALGAFLTDVLSDLFAIDALVLSLPSVISGCLLYELSTRAKTLSGFYRNAAVTVVAGGVLLNMVLVDSSLSLLVTLLSGGLMMLFSYNSKHRIMMLASLLMVASALIRLTWDLWFSFDISAWLISAVIGVTAIVAGSMLESRGDRLKQRWVLYKSGFAEWSY